MNDSKKTDLAGIGAIERNNLSRLLRETHVTISITEAAEILSLKRIQAAKLLAKFAKKGWLVRIQSGIYMPVELASSSRTIVAEDPFAIAEKLFSPCYIGGMNAANYWGLTEQIFSVVSVMTQNQVRKRELTIAGNEYAIHSIKSLYFFGLKAVWSNGVKASISDPTRTIIDMLLFPQFCGGMRFIVDVLQNYYQSKYKDINLLMSYLAKADNGAAIKRMGFLVEKYLPDENKLIDYCITHLTEGYINLSPSLDCPRLVRRWRLWIPDSWKELK